MQLRILLDLFLTFMRIGAFTFGGGYAMIPLIEKEIVEKKHWIEKSQILTIFAISQSIPGAVAINTSTLVGYKIAGKKGAIAATFGVVLPSFIIISLIAIFYDRLDPNVAEPFFMGINGAIIALIFTAALRMYRAAVYNKWTVVIYLVALFLIVFKIISPIFVILISAVPGLILLRFNQKRVDEICTREKE